MSWLPTSSLISSSSSSSSAFALDEGALAALLTSFRSWSASVDRLAGAVLQVLKGETREGGREKEEKSKSLEIKIW
jgi:hypothetical protein